MNGCGGYLECVIKVSGWVEYTGRGVHLSQKKKVRECKNTRDSEIVRRVRKHSQVNRSHSKTGVQVSGSVGRGRAART